jgi:hypothetical protein
MEVVKSGAIQFARLNRRYVGKKEGRVEPQSIKTEVRVVEEKRLRHRKFVRDGLSLWRQ